MTREGEAEVAADGRYLEGSLEMDWNRDATLPFPYYIAAVARAGENYDCVIIGTGFVTTVAPMPWSGVKSGRTPVSARQRVIDE
jgi:hypothetical protein